jgi:hypothetical protein
VTEVIELLRELFRPARATKQFSRAMKPFPALAQTSGNGPWLSVCQRIQRPAAGIQNGDSQMRTLSFILAFVFVAAGSSMAGSSEAGMPGVGTFAYNGSSIAASAGQAIVVAAR